jgi:hypothetical protein
MNDKKEKMNAKDKNRRAFRPFPMFCLFRVFRDSRTLRMPCAPSAFPIFRMFPEQGIFISNRPFQGPAAPVLHRNGIRISKFPAAISILPGYTDLLRSFGGAGGTPSNLPQRMV